MSIESLSKSFITPKMPQNVLENEGKWVVIAHALDGNGDISCSFKVADFLKEHGVPQKNIVIASNLADKEVPEQWESFAYLFSTRDPGNKLKMFNRDNYLLIPYEEIPKIDHIALKIFSPANTKHDVLNHLKTPGPLVMLYEFGYPTEALPEFLKDWVFPASFGLDKEQGQIGVLYSKELINDHPSLEKEKFFDQLDQDLKKAMLGHLKSFKELSDTQLIYFGYAKEEMTKGDFIHAIVSFNKNNTKDLLFILPGFDMPIKDEYLSRFFSEHQVKHFEMIDVKNEKKLFELNMPLKEGKRIRVIPSDCKNQDVINLLKITEKQMITTGDQSLIEAISADKDFSYETCRHKVNTANYLRKYYFPSNPIFSSYSTLCQSFYDNASNQYANLKSKNSQLIQNTDATSALHDLFSKAVKAKKMPYKLLLNKEEISEEDIPLNEDIIVDLKTVLLLAINTQTNQSNLTIFKDSIFTSNYLGIETYHIRRTKKS